ncbi:serine/threonine-protein phosphatase 2A activator isoform X3 [Ahaetulla prasina]|uniref:serine/threonine-protein phosphatase 2A activator isoform X3 n=1 Tax=Ahaetulla prasina TaxID=499056 RepID=UPI0026473F75|nr:serine/threonine-protein phosphatase 2A activator isoform X3 [Ahaetulla prasina]
MAESERQPEASEETQPPPPSQTFMIPRKEINMVPDMAKWKRSQAYADYMGFILTLNEGIKGKKLTCEYKVSEPIEKLVTLLNTLDRWIDETPPVDQPSRFGNKAFRTWYAKVEQGAESLVATVVPKQQADAVPEVAVYLKESVGNSTRIDYGTGHEAAFAAFLCCLCKIGVLRLDDQLAIVFKVFNRYLEVMRKLQKTYRMEPAGSQGVWGLDDFQFLPFIWGSSQLIDHPSLEPRHFVDERVVNEQRKDYMFLECVRFITERNHLQKADSLGNREAGTQRLCPFGTAVMPTCLGGVEFQGAKRWFRNRGCAKGHPFGTQTQTHTNHHLPQATATTLWVPGREGAGE